MTNFEDVGDFHCKFALPHTSCTGESFNPDDPTQVQIPSMPGPQPPNDDLLEFRTRFLIEELQEFMEGAGFEFADDAGSIRHTMYPTMPDHAKMADALVDLVYVAMGTAHVLGYPWEELWDDVQRANMSKKRAAKDGSDSSSGREPQYDVIKPPGWRGPSTAGILRNVGFDV